MSVRRSPENSSRLAVESVQCSICNDTNAEIEFVKTPCQHRFDRTCVTVWLLQNKTCPNCRLPCLSSQLNNSKRGSQDTTLEVLRVQNDPMQTREQVPFLELVRIPDLPQGQPQPYPVIVRAPPHKLSVHHVPEVRKERLAFQKVEFRNS